MKSGILNLTFCCPKNFANFSLIQARKARRASYSASYDCSATVTARMLETSINFNWFKNSCKNSGKNIKWGDYSGGESNSQFHACKLPKQGSPGMCPNMD